MEDRFQYGAGRTVFHLKPLPLCIGLLAAVTVPVEPALARGSRSATATCDGTGCVSEATSVQEVSGGRSRPRRRSPSACVFRSTDVRDGTPVYRPDGSVIEVDGTGRWYEKRCQIEVPQTSAPFGSVPGTGEVGRRAETSELVYLRRRPAPPAEIAMEALGYLPLPEPFISTSPPSEFDSVVNVPVFLSIDNSEWETKSVTTGVPGVSIEVTAVPQRVEWDTGTGDVVVCEGPGTPYDFSRQEADQVADCTYSYRRTSAGQPNERFPLTATVVWRASWTVVGAPGGGDLGEVRRSSSTSLRVAQVQTMNVN